MLQSRWSISQSYRIAYFFQCHTQALSELPNSVPVQFSPHIHLAAWTRREPSSTRKGETSLPSCLCFKRPSLENRRFSSPDGLQTYHPVIFFFFFFFSQSGPVMSQGPNCNGSYLIKVGGFEQRVRGGWGIKGVPLLDSSSFPFVKLSALVHPWVFPCDPTAKTDGHNGRMDRPGRPSLCCELRLTRARDD